MNTARPLGLFDKLWNSHVIADREDGASLIWVDRHYVQEGSFHGFNMVRARKEKLARPDLTVAIADHYVPTRDRDKPMGNPEMVRMIDQLEANVRDFGIPIYYDMHHPWQGIIHVVGPELGMTLAGPGRDRGRQPYLDARRPGRLGLRDRRLGSFARADDPAAVAEAAEASPCRGRRRQQAPGGPRPRTWP